MTAPAASLNDPRWRRRVRHRLQSWYEGAARELPWRGTDDLYRIWVSEVMLQQTQVATVIPYFDRFLEAFPDVRALAAAPEERVLRLWEGLGYYRRARQLHAAARQIVERADGRLPEDADAWRELPGVGRYTANAILSIGRNQRLPILEANSIRVLCRLLGIEEDPARPKVQQALWGAAERLLPRKSVDHHNQALMDLGSTVCRSRRPSCCQCPLESECGARAMGLEDVLPATGKRLRYESVEELVVVVQRRSQVLVRRCEPGERWEGLWDFPRFSSSTAGDSSERLDEVAAGTEELVGVRIGDIEPWMTLRHGVTRFRITLRCYRASYQRVVRRRSSANRRWIDLRTLDEVPLSVTGRKIATRLATMP